MAFALGVSASIYLYTICLGDNLWFGLDSTAGPKIGTYQRIPPTVS